MHQARGESLDRSSHAVAGHPARSSTSRLRSPRRRWPRRRSPWSRATPAGGRSPGRGCDGGPHLRAARSGFRPRCREPAVEDLDILPALRVRGLGTRTRQPSVTAGPAIATSPPHATRTPAPTRWLRRAPPGPPPRPCPPRRGRARRPAGSGDGPSSRSWTTLAHPGAERISRSIAGRRGHVGERHRVPQTLDQTPDRRVDEPAGDAAASSERGSRRRAAPTPRGGRVPAGC